MKNQNAVEELKKFNPDDFVKVTIDLHRKSLLEICYHTGTKFGNITIFYHFSE